MSQPYNHPENQPGLEVGRDPAQAFHQDPSPYYQAASKEQPYSDVEAASPPSTAAGLICGLPKRTFWIVFALALVGVAAALGGGLGGGLAGSNKKAHESSISSSSTGTPQQQQSTSTSSTGTSTSSSSTSSSSTSSTSSSSVPSSTISPGTYRIINIYTNTAIDLYLGGTTSGTQITAWEWDPKGTSASYVHQAWLMASVGNNIVTLYNVPSSQYLTVPSGLTFGVNPSDGAQVYGGGPGSPGDPHTQFTIVKNSDNSISFQSVAYGTKVLDVSGGGTTNGSPIIIWEPNGGTNQRWRLVPS